MIQVTIGTNTNRETVLVDPNKTIKKCLEENGIQFGTASLMLDGATLKAGDINKTFAEMGVTDKCYLMSVQKADNAA